MNISVIAHTCISSGEHSSVSLVAEFLRPGRAFGDAIAHFDVHAYFDEASTENVFQTPFDLFIQKLPLCTYSRAKKRVTLRYVSKVCHAGVIRAHGPVQLDLFAAAAKEVVAQVIASKPKLKKSDVAAYAALKDFVAGRIQNLPTTAVELTSLEREFHKNRVTRVDLDQEDEARDELWVMIKTDEFFSSGIHQKMGDELIRLVEDKKLGINDGRSSGSHQFDVNFDRVENFENAKAAVTEFFKAKYPAVAFVVSNRYESAFDVRP